MQRYLLLSISLCLAAAAQPAAAADQDGLAALLALPVASALTGAAKAQRFAWLITEAGVRHVWFGDPGQPAQRVTRFDADDGEPVYDLVLCRDGRSLAFVKGGDDEYPDDALPNAASAPIPPKQRLFAAELAG